MASKTILVIDADSETEQLIASTLESEGYLVFAVPGGDVGTEMAQKVSPSLIFINPDETGLQMCETIRSYESLKKVPLVLLASPVGGMDTAEAAAYGISDVLKVPFTAQELLEKTARVLDMKAPIVLHVREKEPGPEVEEDSFDDISELPALEQSPETEPEAPQVSWKKDFEETPEPVSVGAKEEWGAVSRDPSWRRRKKSKMPALIAVAVILVVGIVAGALVYLGMIPGMKAKKNSPVKAPVVAAKQIAQSPAPVPPPASTPLPTPAQTPASAAASPGGQPQKQVTAESEPAAAAQASGKKAPLAASPAPPTSVKQVPPQKTAAEPAPSAKLKPSGKAVYSVQLGVFKSEANAAALTKKFKGKGYDAFMAKGTDKDKGTLYRVLVGKASERKESARLAAKIRDAEKVKAVIYAE